MATTRRDIELLISAKETTGRSFSQVTANIDALNRKIAEQVAAAERGEISLQELRQTQQALAAAGRDLSALQGQIDSYTRLVASTEKVNAAYEKAQANLAALQAEIEKAGKSTTAQENRQQRLENALARTSAAVEKNKADIAEQTAVLERAGIAVADLDRAQAGIVNTARQVGAGLVQVNGAIDAYAVNVTLAKDREAAARREAAQSAKLETAEKRVALAQQTLDQQEAVTRQTALIENLREAEQRLAQQNAFDKRIADARRLGDASRFVQLFADAVQTVQSAENQLSALTGFRAVGQQAAEASRDLSRFVEEGQSVAITTSQLANGLRAIIDPGQAALRTLAGIEAEIEKADAAAADGVKNVGLLNDAYNQLAAAASALLRQGGLVDTFRQQESATLSARQQFDAAQADVIRLGQAMAAADAPTEALARSLAQAEQRLQAAGRELNREEAALGRLSRELRDAGINTADLAGEQARLQAAAQRTSTSLERINTTLGRGGRATDGLFGLKPNDLANLSFQLNDIFVSLLSGQNPFVVLIQQGSQIGQIFPGLISTVARLALAFAPLLAVVGAVGVAIFELATDSERLRQVQQDLATIPTGEGLDPERFAAAQEALEGIADKSEEAREALLLLAGEGFTIDQIEAYAEAAGNLAERLGIDVVEATELLTDVNQGGIESVLDLTEKTGSLTEADLDYTQALFDSGRAAEARQFVLDKVAEREAQIANLTESQWTPAVRNLESAFASFAGFLKRTFQPILDAIQTEINNVAVGAAFLTGLLAGRGVDGARADAFEVIRNQRGLNRQPERGSNAQQIRDRRFAAQLDEELDSSRELTRQERLRKAEVEARREAQDAGVSKALEDRAVQQAIAAEQRKINKEAETAGRKGAAAQRRADAAAKRAQREAAAEQRKRETAQRQLESQLRQLNRAAFTGESASLEERLTAINEKYETIADSIAKVRALGLTTDGDGTDLATIEKQVEATKQRLKDEETIKFFQDRAATLEKQREAEIQRVLDARERNAITTGQAMEQTAEIVGRISPQIVEAAQQALVVARALAGTNPSPEMVAWIASLERVINAEQTNRAVADVGLAGLEESSGRLDTLLRERDDLVRSYQVLNELGLRTTAEVQQLTVEAYARQATAIQPVLDQLKQQVELLRNTIDPLTGLPVITDTAYNAWLAKIEAVNAGLTQIDPRLTQINQAVRQAVGQGFTTAFQAAASSIVGLISGTEDFGDTLENLGRTALSVFGSILEAIAQVLVQMVALQFLEAALPGSSTAFGFLFHDGGVVGKGGGSRQRRTGMSDSWFGAPKFHGGGGLGLRPDEYKAVLQYGEEVLTEDDPRHIRNIGKGGGGDAGGEMGLKQVLLLDPAAVPNAMQTRSGQRAVLTVIQANKETIKQVLNG